MILVDAVTKSFSLHKQRAAKIPFLAGASLRVLPGDCVVVIGLFHDQAARQAARGRTVNVMAFTPKAAA